MHIAILNANTDRSSFAELWPNDSDKFETLIREVKPDWTISAFDLTQSERPENLGGFEIRDYNQYQPRSEKEKIVHQVDYIISTFDVGDFDIPPVEIGYKIQPDTVEKILKTENIKIVVESVKPSEDGDIRDIKPP